jgi:hypothetical protein
MVIETYLPPFFSLIFWMGVRTNINLLVLSFEQETSLNMLIDMRTSHLDIKFLESSAIEIMRCFKCTMTGVSQSVMLQ